MNVPHDSACSLVTEGQSRVSEGPCPGLMWSGHSLSIKAEIQRAEPDVLMECLSVPCLQHGQSQRCLCGGHRSVPVSPRGFFPASYLLLQVLLAPLR